jgi:hypothetical protein
MKCFYYLVPTLTDTHHVSDDLHTAGIDDFYIHIVSKNEAGLRQHHLHSSNYIETLDFVRIGFLGAATGLVLGVLGCILMSRLQPFGPNLPFFIYVLLTIAATLFGAWEGGLIGIGSENKKLARFHDDIEVGKYLILLYARKAQEETVRKMMAAEHSESQLVAIDRYFLNPFSSVIRLSDHNDRKLLQKG